MFWTAFLFFQGGQSSSQEKNAEEALKLVNKYREIHDADKLEIDADLMKIALEKANKKKLTDSERSEDYSESQVLQCSSSDKESPDKDYINMAFSGW